ncbi:methyltransferase domain-containing protein [Streptomyces indicus]|uniref:Ubiquinone/menaquinone biosynthesis C-methylase UbiE n=1 Tax=Streptomyces indicus TaxID=417292 RepID=A0A1G8TJM6_9ACTN|nr:methyltransferase domain-containing protein [Streptomyces indicus]SDJ41105.1 Ubiquinone/menaquinone biosynthesis C-methylase UbiE [Streptomyces indicus]
MSTHTTESGHTAEPGHTEESGHTADPERDPVPQLVALLDAHDALPAARRLRARTYELLDAGPGRRIVDAGCGAGRAVGELGERGARAVGVDIDPDMLRIARERHPQAEFRAADLAELPFGDATSDGYRADKVLHTLPDPSRALAEARRVLVPGGRAVLVGQDWDTFVVDAADPALTRTIVQARADLVTNPRAARAHRALLLDAGFTDVTVEVHTSVFTDHGALALLGGFAAAAARTGAITAEESAAWMEDQRQRAAADRLFAAVPMFLAAGIRP